MNSDFLFIERVVEEVFEPDKEWRTDARSLRKYVMPRQVANWCLYYYTDHALSDVSFYFGRREHPMVLHSLLVINSLIQIDYEFSCKIRTIMDYLKGKGWIMKYAHGRRLLSKRTHTYRFPNKFAPKPKQRVFSSRGDDEAVRKHAEFIESFSALRRKRRSLEKATDVDVVVGLAREISVLKTKVKSLC